MDPDVALDELRKLAEYALDGQWAAGDMDAIACELAEKIQALDTWITGGGFLPKEWDLLETDSGRKAVIKAYTKAVRERDKLRSDNAILALRLKKIIEAAHEEGHGALSSVINAVDAANREGVNHDRSDHDAEAARSEEGAGREGGTRGR